MINTNIKKLILLCFIFSFNVHGLKFNSDELFILEGKGLKLADDEGYLLLSINSNENIDSLIIKPVKKGNTFKFRKVMSGENFALLKVKKGEYYWDVFWYYFKAGSVRYNYKKTEHTFKVEPGVINYPGTWAANIEVSGYRKAYHTIDTVNKSAYELRKLRKLHKDIYADYPFKFQGEYKDSYSDFYKNLSKQNNVNTNSSEDYFTSYDRKDGIQDELKSFDKIDTYLTDASQSIGNFSPNGQFLLLKMVDKGISYIRILNLTTYKFATIVKDKLPKSSYIDEVEWIDNDSIYYSVYYDGIYNKRVAHLEIDATQEIIGAKHLNIPIKGNMIDSLDDQENLLYFAKNSIYSKKKNGIYKLDVSNEKSIKKSTKNPHQIIKKLKDAVYGLTANDGVIRFIITSEYVKKNDLIRLHYWFLSKGSDWKEIYTVDLEQDVVVPRMISNDQTFFYATTNNFGDKVAIHKYSTNDFSHLGVFYENNNLEITGIKQDSLTKEIIGVNHVEQGFTKTKYFENDNDNLMPLREKYKDHNFYSAQHNKSINKTLVFSTNEYSKGSWSIYDNKTTKVDKLFETNPSYTKLEKGIFLNIKTKSIDGIDLEGYLVVPKNSKGKKLPLVVIPHGGPIGVRDYAYNSDVQHFYASQGLASLKVNYRGSGGYGKNFKDLGRKQWGKKIESDINHMVEYAIDNYNISNDNICAMGSSYGGYSAVMLTILYPDRYKCAVSFAGVMDIPLMFTSSDFSKNKKSIEEFKKIVGDPENESQSLIQDSPLYLVDKITNPVLLFHGAYDKRVSAEHSFRMKELLDMTNKESDLIILENEAHSLNFIESEIVYISRSLVFIKKQLGLEN